MEPICILEAIRLSPLAGTSRSEERSFFQGLFQRNSVLRTEMAQKAGVTSRHVIVGTRFKTIIEMTKNSNVTPCPGAWADALYDRVMGSTCQSLVRLAPCSVLVVK